nr:ribonuclease H-like domain-containing protein [Tanacetum cinerariifolium]
MKTANTIWYRIKEIMEGIKLTKQEMETKLADEFEKFTLEKGEIIQSYYLRQNQDDANEIRAERAIRNHDPLALVASAMKLALQASNKYSFVDVSQDVYMGLVYSGNANSVWKEIESTYDKVDAYEADAVFDGLDDCYQPIRSALLTRDPFLESLGISSLCTVYLFCDNNFAIQLAANPVFHEKSNHFEIDVHLVREKETRSRVTLVIDNGTGSIQATIPMYDVEIFIACNALELERAEDKRIACFIYHHEIKFRGQKETKIYVVKEYNQTHMLPIRRLPPKVRKNTSSGAKNVEIRHGNEQIKKLKANYGVTTPQELRRNHNNEEIS